MEKFWIVGRLSLSGRSHRLNNFVGPLLDGVGHSGETFVGNKYRSSIELSPDWK